ncbi:SGNH hydrolase-type esterase domain-containing protein [Blyttiomyces helicus]|uniref:SGNH hydrolase-type esterase domain-containing protein n=1 Tax=Blyttiomyces helicus TaxID=388810 RepID=A0A4P9WHU0_9FUNG|nr:SGNH hydrolase-type esterase domain-containing protein [Blyttiomyces helicus]|eukprot:RKO91413.1 SGNH hydrolase-type esterase domain-containing protein [Blyttiomyces helicus]
MCSDLRAPIEFAGATDPRQGWGEPAHALFSLNLTNDALSGRSTRTFISEGHWSALLASIKPGDYVLIEFGHNDQHAIIDGPGVLNGTGNETMTVGNEVVRTFGAYLRQMISDVRRKLCIPVISSMTPRLDFVHNAQVIGTPYVTWAREVALAANVSYLDHNKYTALAYTAIGFQNTVKLFAPGDDTHTDPAGAVVVADAFVRALVCDGTLTALIAGLSAQGKAIAC